MNFSISKRSPTIPKKSCIVSYSKYPIPRQVTMLRRLDRTSLKVNSYGNVDRKIVIDERLCPNIKAEAARLCIDPSPFLEPLLRALMLGLIIGIMTEIGHMLIPFSTLFHNGDFENLNPETLITLQNDLYRLPRPDYVADHVTAITIFLLCYGIEAKALCELLKDDGDLIRTAKDISSSMTLPKKIFPWRMSPIKLLLIYTFTGRRLTYSKAFEPLPVTPEIESEGFGFRKNDENILRKQPMPSIISNVQSNHDHDVEDDFTYLKTSKRASELKSRKSFLKNFWYAAAHSDEIIPNGTQKGIDILGQTIVVWRENNGQIRALSDVCPHRGAPLHRGWTETVEDSRCIVCPYHGWAFDHSGRIRSIPANENPRDINSLQKSRVIKSWDAVEKGGFIWIFYGSSALPVDERPPIPFVDELDDRDWRAAYGSIEFDCSHDVVFENAIDVAHIHYLHSGTFGNRDQPHIKNVRVKRDAFGVTADLVLHNKPVNRFWGLFSIPQVFITARACLPSTSIISFTLGAGLSFTTFVNTVPVDDNKSVNRFALIRKLGNNKIINGLFNWSGFDHIAVRAMHKILAEDKLMVENLRPDMLDSEISIRPDMLQIQFRKLRKEYTDMNY